MERIFIAYLVVLTAVSLTKLEGLSCEKDVESYEDGYSQENVFEPIDDPRIPCTENLVPKKTSTAALLDSPSPTTVTVPCSSIKNVATTPGFSRQAREITPSSSNLIGASSPGSPDSAAGFSRPTSATSPASYTGKSPKTDTSPNIPVLSAAIIVAIITIFVLIFIIARLLRKRRNISKTTFTLTEHSLAELIPKPRECETPIESDESNLDKGAANEADDDTDSDLWSIRTARSSSSVYVTTSLEMETTEL